jgi:hypothetical protein
MSLNNIYLFLKQQPEFYLNKFRMQTHFIFKLYFHPNFPMVKLFLEFIYLLFINLILIK